MTGMDARNHKMNQTNMKPLVSVVMPAYNVSSYIDEAIQSILEQSLTDFELIIINDGSTDDSLERAKLWAEKDKRIKLYDQENKGRSYTRNRALELACSDLVATMDSDDVSLPNRLEVQYNFMNANPDVVVVGGQVDAICMMGLDLYTTNFPLHHQEIEQALLNDDGVQLCQPATMMRKSIALDAGGYDQSYSVGEDTDLFLRMALKGKLANVNEVLLKYRKHPESSTNASNSGIYRESLSRIKKAWADRGIDFPDNFQHWSDAIRFKSPKDDLLKWGWNALAKGEFKKARAYAKKLVSLGSFDLSSMRFYFCVLRNR